MKKIFGFGIIIVVLAMPLISLAAEFKSGDQPSVRVDEKIADDLYIVGGSVTSAGSIEGDLIAAGGNIIISGDVGADVIVAGGNVSILSDVGDDVRAAGGNIVIEGKVGGDAILAGGQISIGGPGIGGDLIIGGGNIRVDAPVMGKVSIEGGTVYLNAPINGDIKIEAGTVTLGSAAIISGNITYKSNKEIVKEAGAVVEGKIIFEPRAKKEVSPMAFVAAFSIWKFFALLACALLFGMVFRRYNKEIINLAVKRPFSELGRGLVILIATPVISILLFVTLVGIPLGILGILGFLAMMLFAWIVAPIILGSIIYRYFSKRELEVSWKTILIGVFVYSLLGIVPFIGWLAEFILMLITLGSIASLKWQILKEWR